MNNYLSLSILFTSSVWSKAHHFPFLFQNVSEVFNKIVLEIEKSEGTSNDKCSVSWRVGSVCASFLIFTFNWWSLMHNFNWNSVYVKFCSSFGCIPGHTNFCLLCSLIIWSLNCIKFKNSSGNKRFHPHSWHSFGESVDKVAS